MLLPSFSYRLAILFNASASTPSTSQLRHGSKVLDGNPNTLRICVTPYPFLNSSSILKVQFHILQYDEATKDEALREMYILPLIGRIASQKFWPKRISFLLPNWFLFIHCYSFAPVLYFFDKGFDLHLHLGNTTRSPFIIESVIVSNISTLNNFKNSTQFRLRFPD